jgi:hypothetical protein
MQYKTAARIWPLIFCALTLSTGVVIAQPPAEGPSPTGAQFGSLPMSVVLNMFEQNVQSTLDGINAQIQRQKDSTNISASVSYSYTSFPADLVATLLTDRPNENQVHVPLMVTFNITGIRWHGIPYFDRKIYETIDFFASCHNWATGKGFLQLVFNAQQPYQDGYSFGEQALDFFITNTLSNYVDGQLQSRLRGSGVTTIPDNLAVCNCLGVTPGTESNNHYKDGEVRFSYNKPRVIIGGGILTNSNVTVTIQSIKRLAAHNNYNMPLYQPVENITLQVYVNESEKVIQVGNMKEGDVFPIQNTAVNLPIPADTGMIVIIADIIQNTYNYAEDSEWDVYKKNTNFGNGTQQLTVTKSYFEQPRSLPGGGISKPIKVTVGAYEISMLVGMPNNTYRQ